MARFDQVMMLYPQHPIQSAVFAFDFFMSEKENEGAGNSFTASLFDTTGVKAQCLLDEIYVWLVEGPAVKICPTYESFLLAVIGIIDHRTRNQRDGVDHGELTVSADSHVKIFCWGSQQDESDSSKAIEGGEGLAHPALMRETYDYQKQQYGQLRDAPIQKTLWRQTPLENNS